MEPTSSPPETGSSLTDAPLSPPSSTGPGSVSPPGHPGRLAASGLHGVERQHFRWRGVEVSRLENFSDVVFAFALTLLVVSNEVPHTFSALMAVLRGFPAFAFTFMLLVSFWYNHYLFFRRYGLHDTVTAALNNVLLLLVLFCVYPLKFLATLLNDNLSPWAAPPAVAATAAGVTAVTATAGAAIDTLHYGEFTALLRLYAAALGSIFFVYVLLYGRAWRLRDALQLNPAERLATLRMLCGFGLTILMCAVSVALTFALTTLGWAGLVYLFLIPVLIINASIFRRRIRRIAAAGT